MSYVQWQYDPQKHRWQGVSEEWNAVVWVQGYYIHYHPVYSASIRPSDDSSATISFAPRCFQYDSEAKAWCEQEAYNRATLQQRMRQKLNLMQ
ncbi:MAG: hypothetical protein HC837_06255 [Chloroflexaceae bacterium]|nr:hypothetical protein [Chloroflexaceae bacterium]